MAEPVIGESLRTCTKCELQKPATFEFFSAKKTSKSGFVSHCKSCVAEAGRATWADPEYRARETAKRHVRYAEPDFREKEAKRQARRNSDPVHLAKEAERQKRRQADSAHLEKERVRGAKRRTKEAYRARVQEYGKSWYAKNHARHAVTGKKRYELRRSEIAALRADPQRRQRANQWTRAHLKKNPWLKVQRALGARMAEVLKAGTTRGAFRHLPYSYSQLRAHLERQFQCGMSWENYGSEWHVDHVLPVASFTVDANDPANCPEFQACWALPNLQPLWKAENQSKSAKRLYLI